MFNTASSILGSNQKSVEAAGTAYSLTNTAAAAAFGTTSPSITLDKAGTYAIFASANLLYNAATFAAVRTATLKLRRTNNTAADLTGMTRDVKSGIITLLTYSLPNTTLMGIYTTTNTDDIISLFANLDVVPTAGSLDLVQASIVAFRLNP